MATPPGSAGRRSLARLGGRAAVHSLSLPHSTSGSGPVGFTTRPGTYATAHRLPRCPAHSLRRPQEGLTGARGPHSRGPPRVNEASRGARRSARRAHPASARTVCHRSRSARTSQPATWPTTEPTVPGSSIIGATSASADRVCCGRACPNRAASPPRFSAGCSGRAGVWASQTRAALLPRRYRLPPSSSSRARAESGCGPTGCKETATGFDESGQLRESFRSGRKGQGQ